MNYPKLHPEQWKNSKLTLVERDEIDYYVNHAGWSHKRVAEMYHVTIMTVKYWSDPEYKRKDNERTTLRLKRNMEDPVFRKRQTDRQKVSIMNRMRNDPEYLEWMRSGRKYDNITPERREGNRKRAKKRYQTKREDCKIQARRSYRARDNNGFRMFMKHINKPLNLDNICHSKKEMQSISSYKSMDASITKSYSQTEKRSSTTLQNIIKTILQPIHVLKRVFSNE